jgi:integrase
MFGPRSSNMVPEKLFDLAQRPRKVELHRFRKTYADTLHEEGVSVNTIRIRLGHESLDVTLAYLKGKDAESEEAQQHANSSSLALYA